MAAQWFTRDPVNTRTGSYWNSFTDLAVQSPGPAIVWSRSYASQATSDVTTTLGFGWQHPYAARLIPPAVAGGDVTIISAVGNQLHFASNGNGTYKADGGIYSTLVHANNVYTQTLRDQQQLIFSDTTGRLTGMRDPLGRQLTLTYNAATPPQLTKIADAIDATRALTLTYTLGRVTGVTDGVRSVTYTYTNGDLTAVQDVRGQTTQYAYTNHLLWKITNPLNQIVESMGYSGSGAASTVITQTLQDGRKLNFGYLASTTILTTTGVDGRRSIQRFTYGSDNALTNISDTSDSTHTQSLVSSVFDSSFSPGTVVDGRNNTTATTYTSNGLPLVQTNALGQTARTIYDTQNHPISTTDPLGVSTLFTYDKLGNLLTMTAGVTTTSTLRATTIYTYTYLNASNAWVSLSQPLTAPLPKDSRLSDQRAPDGVVTHYDYDATKAHQVTKVTFGYGTALKQETTYGYDALGRVTSTTAAANDANLARTDTTVYNPDNTIAKTIQNYKGCSPPPSPMRM